MVTIHLYGKLRGYGAQASRRQNDILRQKPAPDETVASLLNRLGIPAAEIYSIFLNSRLLAARTGMAQWIGYRQHRATPFDWNLEVPVKAGDRIGLFGRDMAALVI